MSRRAEHTSYLRPLLPLVVLLAATACTSTSGTPGGTALSCGDGGPYGLQGSILAVDQTGTTNPYSLVSDFPAFLPAAVNDAPPPQPECCCYMGKDGPTPGDIPGTVTLKSATGETLASIAGFSTTSLAWTPGDTLEVFVTGGLGGYNEEVPAFSGSLPTAALPSGISAPVGAMPVMIDRSQDFEIAWTPESQGNDQIVLTLNANAYSCVCAAATSAGAITVGSALLSKFDASSNGFIELARYTMSTACGNNQTIVLGGVTSVQGTVTLE